VRVLVAERRDVYSVLCYNYCSKYSKCQCKCCIL
jgi:heme/copper-type cytochrome/quinol oxidase subunit 2